MYIYVYIYIYIIVYVYVHMYMYICICIYVCVYIYISPSLHGSTRSTSRYLRSHSQVTCLEWDSAIIESLGMAQKKGTGNWEPLFFSHFESIH